MTSLAARVLRSVRARALLSAGDRIVVAVSGGADSVALVHLLLEITPSLDAAVVGVAHLHHGLRGSGAPFTAVTVALGAVTVQVTEDRLLEAMRALKTGRNCASKR